MEYMHVPRERLSLLRRRTCLFFMQVTLNEYFKDEEYQPVLMRSGSYSATASTGGSTVKSRKLTEST